MLAAGTLASVHLTSNTRYRGRASIPIAMWALMSAGELAQQFSDYGFSDVTVWMHAEELPADWPGEKTQPFPDLGVDKMIWAQATWKGAEGDLTFPDGIARVDFWSDSSVNPAADNPSQNQSHGASSDPSGDLPAPQQTTATVEAFPPDQPQNAQQARAMLIAAYTANHLGVTPTGTQLAVALAVSRAETDWGLGKYADPVTHALRTIVVPGNWGAVAESSEHPPAAGELWSHLVAAGDRDSSGKWFAHLFRAYDLSFNGARDFWQVLERALGSATWPDNVDDLAARLQAGHYYAGPIKIYTANLDRANAANCKAGVECLAPSSTSSSSSTSSPDRAARGKRALWIALPIAIFGFGAAVAAEVLPRG